MLAVPSKNFLPPRPHPLLMLSFSSILDVRSGPIGVTVYGDGTGIVVIQVDAKCSGEKQGVMVSQRRGTTIGKG